MGRLEDRGAGGGGCGCGGGAKGRDVMSTDMKSGYQPVVSLRRTIVE